jgi:ribosomal protein L37AE/L43A
MDLEEKNRSKILSRLVVDLFVRAKGGEELSHKIRRLRDEIKKVIESEDTIFGKFRGLVESFREIIPEEKQRYSAAIKALSTTAKISRQEIVKAVGNQLEELKILKKGLLGTSPGWRDGFKAMEAKSREMKDEISKLQEKIARLQSEEKQILSDMATREKEMEVVEKAVEELFTDIAAEVALISKKVEESAAASAVSQPAPIEDSLVDDILSDKKGGGQKNESSQSYERQNSELQKSCPMCGGIMNFYMKEKMWRCYSCAYEELKEEKINPQKSETRETVVPQDTKAQRICPMCGGHMDFNFEGQVWICYSCAHEESSPSGYIWNTREDESEPEAAPAGESTFDPFPDLATPSTSPSSSKHQEANRESSSKKQPFFKKKPCPVCHKKMNWNQTDGAWRCPYCQYERKI